MFWQLIDNEDYLLAGIEEAGSGLVLEGKVGRQEPLQPQSINRSFFATIPSLDR